MPRGRDPSRSISDLFDRSREKCAGARLARRWLRRSRAANHSRLTARLEPKPLYAEGVRIPLQPQLARRRHVPDQGRGGDDRWAGQVTLAAEAHAVLPVAIERGDRTLTLDERIGTLTEAGPAPRLTNLAAGRSKDVGNRFAAEARIGTLDLRADAARAGKDHERLLGTCRALFPRRADHQRCREQVVVAAIGARPDHGLVERETLPRPLLGG